MVISMVLYRSLVSKIEELYLKIITFNKRRDLKIMSENCQYLKKYLREEASFSPSSKDISFATQKKEPYSFTQFTEPNLPKSERNLTPDHEGSIISYIPFLIVFGVISLSILAISFIYFSNFSHSIRSLDTRHEGILKFSHLNFTYIRMYKSLMERLGLEIDRNLNYAEYFE